MNNQSNHQTNWLHFWHFQLKKYLAVGGGGSGGGGVGGGKNSLNHKITIYIFLGVYWAYSFCSYLCQLFHGLNKKLI